MRFLAVIALASLFLTGCGMLRSRRQGEIEWNLLVFPGATQLERDLAARPPVPFSSVARGCISPDSITLSASVCDSAAAGRFVLVGSWRGGRYRPDLTRVLMQSASARGAFASGAAALAAGTGLRGMILDFPSMGPRDVEGLTAVVSALRDSARAGGVGPVAVVVPAADTAGYPGRLFGAVTDFVIVRLEQPEGTAGAVSPRASMRRFVGVRAGEIGASRLLVAIPVFGRIRPEGQDPIRISYLEALRTAAEWGVRFERDESSHALVARHPRLGDIWLNDALAVAALVRDARRLGVTRFALYGAGGEDPAIWRDVVVPAAR